MVGFLRNCGNDTESTLHLRFHCANLTIQRQTLMDKIHLTGANIVAETKTSIVQTA